ncbi:hypothetical protein AVEN_108017-1 [Araneus ventricosus]|uniref:Uncharacterized protein n=1 Tax=Araneus ventricosus TaxID=182803 RepID=A0A4Y2DRU5_ARAVE|nr:hypothetical protein AVEN_108017-1 [Araneus ventricosus]
MTPRVSPIVAQTSYFTWLIWSARCFPFRIEVFTCFSQCLLHMKKKERLHTLHAEVETDEDSDFENEDHGPEDVLELNSSYHENFSANDTESEEDGDSGNEKVMCQNGFHPKMAYSGGKQIRNVIILCRAYLDQKNQPKI